MRQGPRTACIAFVLATVTMGIAGVGDESNVADEVEESLVSAQEILDRSVETYLGCQSYRDSGVVRIVFTDPQRERVVERPFETVFSRGGQFRFEFTNRNILHGWQAYIVWTDGDEVLTWWDVEPGIESKESLSNAIARATGVSGGSAHAVPILLMPDRIGGRTIARMTDLERHANEIVGSAECFRISGVYGGEQRTLWIDTSSSLIRRITWRTIGEGFSAESTLTYDPAVNIDIPAQDLTFDPPSGE